MAVAAAMAFKKENGRRRHWMLLFQLLSFTICFGLMNVNATSVGVNYGLLGDNLPHPSVVVSLMRSISVKKTRIYTAEPTILTAFANTGISVIIGTRIDEMSNLTNLAYAETWVKQNVIAFLPGTHIIGIAVGNEVLPGYMEYAQYLLPAMKNIHVVLVSAGLQRQIWVSTAHALSVLGDSYPPSQGYFRQDLAEAYIRPLLDFHSQTASPFLVNVYPFLSYISDPETISLEYALFEDGASVVDPNSSLTYTNMFDSQLDAVYAAMEKLGYSNIPLVISETGWPSRGDTQEPGATVANAQLYIANLVRYLASGKGTPMRPSSSIDVYIFALFNEDLKPGPTSERNFGLFNPNGTSVFDLSHVSASTVELVSSSAQMVSRRDPFTTMAVYLVFISLLTYYGGVIIF